MRRKLALLGLVGGAAAVAVAFGFSGVARSAATVSQLPSSSCSPLIYKGSGSPDFIVATDLPLQGAVRHQTLQIADAALWDLQNRGWKAGRYKIGYQSCDDSTAQTGGWDTAKCATNARLYASNKSVIGVVGTFNSGCAKIEVPVLNRAGPLAEVSPANTNVGLTKKWDAGEPNKYYPTGVRNYARVVATDDIQGPAGAIFTKSLGTKKVFILNDKQTYGFGVAKAYQFTAKKIGLNVVGFQGWDGKATSYEALANSIKASGATVVYLGGIVCNNGAKLMQDIKAVNPKIQLQAPDGFSDPTAIGAVGNGMYASVAGQPPNKLTGAGADFIKAFGKQIGALPNPYAAYGAQAMDVMLTVIAKGGGQRAATTKALFGLTVTNGILGTFTLNAAGDTNLQPITIYKQAGKLLNPVTTIVPPANLEP